MAKRKWKPPPSPKPDYDLLVPYGDLGILSGATSEMLAKKGLARWWAFNGEAIIWFFFPIFILVACIIYVLNKV